MKERAANQVYGRIAKPHIEWTRFWEENCSRNRGIFKKIQINWETDRKDRCAEGGLKLLYYYIFPQKDQDSSETMKRAV